MKSKKLEDKEYNGSDIEYEQEEEKKFKITRGMLILATIAILFIIIIIILIKSLFSGNTTTNTYTIEDFKKLEQRMEEEAPIYVYQKNIELTEEKIEINLEDLLTTNGGSIDPKKNKATEICDGYVIANNEGSDNYNAYIKCGDKYTTDVYIEKEKSTTKNKSTTKKTTTKVKDDVKPDILIVGEKEITLYVGDKYKEPGYTATDNIDGDITSNVTVEGKVDTSKKGTYTLTYKIKDKAGNSNETTRKVIVLEKTTTRTQTNPPRTTTTQRYTQTTRKTTYNPPVTTRTRTSPTIVLHGSRDMTLYKGEKYNEPGYTAKDADDKDITSKVTVKGEVNTNKAGVYTITYHVVDDYGYSFTTSRIVAVKENKQIIYVKNITLTPNSKTIKVGDTLNLVVNFTPSNATDMSVSWKSSNSSVATVSNSGRVTGLKRGVVTITATSSNGKTATSEITVN